MNAAQWSKCGAALAGLFLSGPVHAGELTTATLDGGGAGVTGGAVHMEGSLGGFAGIADDAAGVRSRTGFPAQIYDPLTLAITPDSASIEEFGTAAFAVQFRCDDDSLLPAAADGWSVSNVFATVSADGQVEVEALPGNVTATLTATSGAYEGTAELSLRDISPDNYGSWAADGIPDEWQALYFSGQEADGTSTADPDADGQDNRTEFLAGTDPLDPASLLVLRFGADAGPEERQFIFTPFLPDRTYTLEWSAAVTAPWTALPASPSPGTQPGEGQFIDAAGGDARKFYRLRITVL